MPLPKPSESEKRTKNKDTFISRCMSHPVMKREFPDTGQRWKVCEKRWKTNQSERI